MNTKLETAILNSIIKSPSNVLSKTNLLRSVYHLLSGGASELDITLDDMIRKGTLHVRKKGKGLLYSAFSTPSELFESTNSVITEDKIEEIREKGGRLCPVCKGHGYIPRSVDIPSTSTKEDTHLNEEKEIEEVEREEIQSILDRMKE